ncbi:hypothetical protein [Mycolicibacterium sp. 050158]|jgi:hypothetical protein|uniref:hypothetical protein n=1 Tax=Mycolicibacterium sp. 050158 TaxID=3090602 RepID=UPI00299DD127|nr:hypothetical protein [Mycolicibacterium sp. 050158]MDX1893403.1 hypothetical protein [Mycolicibacterium sp. 050158]
MSTAAEKIKANAERLREKPLATPSVPAPASPQELKAPSPVRGQPTIVRQKTVRRTVDLSPTAHRGLDGWQRDTADRLGLARVTGQDVLAALVDRLLADPDLADLIVQVIADRRA